MANNWQFFLQKKGSRSWKKIASSNINLPEGVYRVMALTNLKNTEIKLCVFHQYEKKGEIKQRFYTSSHVTDEKGLLPILPFTYLKPKVWELFCNFQDDAPPQETLTINIQEIKEKVTPQIQIVFNQEHFILEPEANTILLSGVIKNRNQIGELTEPLEGKIYLQLRESQTGEILFSNQEAISETLPYHFKEVIANINWPVELILGELILVDKNSNILSRESFTITINFEELLHRGKYKRYHDHLELLQFNKLTKNGEELHHSEGQVLPPKIPQYHPYHRTKIIDLPKFSSPKTNLNHHKNGHQNNNNSASLVTKTNRKSAISLPEIKPKSAKVDQEFASLNLENKFISRLQNLALIPHKEHHNKTEQTKQESYQEIPLFNGNIANTITEKQLDILSVSAPEITILSSEIKPEIPLLINVKISNHTNNITVKIWLQDRQTRSLIIEPIYVYGFILNENNQLETTTEIIIPFGCMEVILSAITIDNNSQRESYKTSLILPISLI